MVAELSTGYRLVEGPPRVGAYLSLRERAGMSLKTRAQAYVSLLADPPGRRLYERNGFADTAPMSLGMARRVP